MEAIDFSSIETWWWALVLGAYLLGAVPFGLVITRLAGGPDILSIGSKNIGATNVLRTGNKKLAALTLLCDALKGYAAVVAASMLSGHVVIILAASAAAILGHIYPVYLRFKGGKGVATYLGVLFGLSPVFGLGFVAVWLLVFALTRISSLSALSALVAVVVGCSFTPWAFTLVHGFLLAASALVFAKHHANIKRLLKGEEPRFGTKKEATA